MILFLFIFTFFCVNAQPWVELHEEPKLNSSESVANRYITTNNYKINLMEPPQPVTMGLPQVDSVEEPNEGIHVVLLGDSVLDNFYWISDHKLDVRKQLELELHKNGLKSRVSNWAVDESTINCVLHGSTPRSVYATARNWYGLEPYPTEKNGKVYPLRLLAQEKATHAVLSIGGNDARAAFIQSFDINNIYHIMLEYGTIDSFDRLVSSITKNVPNLILSYVYHPQITFLPIIYGLPGANVVKELLVRFSPMLINSAKKHKIPIIDLSRTFDPYDSSDYGTTPIEPSNKSGMKIAQLISRVIGDFQFGQEEGKIYWGVGDSIQSEVLDSGWNENKYRVELERHLKFCEERCNQNSCVVS